MIKRIFYLAILMANAMPVTYAQSISIDVNLDMQHTLDTITRFDRNKFVAVHSDIGENEWDEGYGAGAGPNFTADLRDDFLNGYDVYLGRNTGGVTWYLNNVITEDGSRPGYADSTSTTSYANSAKSNYISNTNWHTYEERNDKVICLQLHPFYPDGQLTAQGWAFSQTDTEEEPFGTATGEYYGRWIRDAFGSGGTNGQPRPKYAEVINEPLWHLVDYGSHTPLEVFRFHNAVAEQIRTFDSDIQIGGFCTAFPDLENNGFSQWEERWKLFMDSAGANMDFWTIHLYDFPSISGGNELYRKGSNMEATFDMMEQYSYHKFGVVKPFMVSEYGAQMHDYFGAWSPYRDWLHLKSVNSMMMQFMERANIINKTINFLPVKAIWGTTGVTDTYNHRLMVRENEPVSYTGTWIYSEMVKTYQLWSDVKGIRVDSHSENPDIMTDAYINGNKVYVIINNLDFVSHELDLNILGSSETLDSVRIKHLYLNGTTDSDSPALDVSTVTSAPSTLTIAPEGTYILEYNYATDITIDESSTETKYYADEMLQAISANTPITFNINGVSTATYGEAILRLGVGRSHGLSLQPIVTVNGTSIEIPDNFRGDPQTDRATFFGVLEIPVSYGQLETDNVITVQFPDNGGHVSSLAMQVFEFSKQVSRSWEVPVTGVTVTPETLTVGIGQKRQLTAAVIPGNAANQVVSWNSDADGIASVNPATGEITGIALGTAHIIATTDEGGFKDTCIVTVQNEIVPVSVDSVVLSPVSATIIEGETYQLLYQLYPSDITDDTVYWESDMPGVASVDENGLVTAESVGEAVITIRTNDGNFTDTCYISVEAGVDPSITLDNQSNYTLPTFTIGEPIEVTTNYHAGTGNVVTGDGIKYRLRLIEETPAWVVRNDVIVDDAATIGTQSGISTVSIPTTGLTPTSELEDNFLYYLFVVMSSSNGTDYSHNAFPIKIENPQVPVTGVEIVSASITLAVGEIQTLTAIISPSNASDTTINWSSDAAGIASINSGTGEITALATGIANITVTTADGSYTDVCQVTVLPHLSISDNLIVADIKVYPNPVQDELFISGLNDGAYNVRIYNVMGDEVFSNKMIEDISSLNVSLLPDGMYVLFIQNGTNTRTIRFSIAR